MRSDGTLPKTDLLIADETAGGKKYRCIVHVMLV